MAGLLILLYTVTFCRNQALKFSDENKLALWIPHETNNIIPIRENC
ncbi:hypothetical protein [Cytobacillus sp. BC1816]